MENKNSKKKLIISLVVLALVGLAVFYFYKNYKKPFTSPPPASTGQVHNPAEKLPDTNPYDAETNPFETAKTNPFKDIYKNPFSK